MPFDIIALRASVISFCAASLPDCIGFALSMMAARLLFNIPRRRAPRRALYRRPTQVPARCSMLRDDASMRFFRLRASLHALARPSRHRAGALLASGQSHALLLRTGQQMRRRTACMRSGRAAPSFDDIHCAAAARGERERARARHLQLRCFFIAISFAHIDIYAVLALHAQCALSHQRASLPRL